MPSAAAPHPLDLLERPQRERLRLAERGAVRAPGHAVGLGLHLDLAAVLGPPVHVVLAPVDAGAAAGAGVRVQGGTPLDLDVADLAARVAHSLASLVVSC